MNKHFRNAMIALGLGSAAAIGGAVSNVFLSGNASFARTAREVSEARANLAVAGDLSSVFKSVSKAVEPSVVQIQTKAVVTRTGFNGGGNPFGRMFPFGGNNDGEGTMELPGFNGQPQQFEQQGTGSGVIMQVEGSTGYILTNNHVVDHAKALMVTLNDGRQVEGSTVGVDPRTDLAVVRINADNLIAAPWGESGSLEKGDWVIAFGSPLGYVGSMTHGIVSALNRTVGILGQAGIEEFIQTDAPINPGNSGGPLVNTKGEVIGINSCIASQSGGSQGIGFAVPQKLARPVFEHIKSDGKVNRGWLGVQIADTNAPDEDNKAHVEASGFKGKGGVIIREVMRGAPAAQALQPDDVITAINGTAIKSMNEFRETVALFAPGTAVKFSVVREGKAQDVTVKLGDQPEQVASETGEHVQRFFRAPRGEQVQGLTLRNLSEQSAKQFGLEPTDKGALVLTVQPNSVGAKAGLTTGDLIVAVNGTPVSDSADAAKLLKGAGKTARLTVLNGSGTRIVILRDK